MKKYILQRTFTLFISFFASLMLIFILLRLLPGDPANAILPSDASPEQILAAQIKVGSNKPLAQQYAAWFADVLRGNFGTSIISGTSVSDEVFKRLEITIPLTLISFLISVFLAGIIGFICAYKNGKWYASILTAFTQIGLAIPIFWIGIIFVMIFSLRLHLLPSSGWNPDGFKNFGAAVRSFVLPVCTIVFMMTCTLSRYVRASVLTVLDSPFIKMSRAMGFSLSQSFLLHGLRSSCVPVISILGIELSATLLGAVVVENIFALPGLGSMLSRSIAQHDYTSIQGVLLTTTFLVLLIGFAADVFQRVLDPRLTGQIT